MEFKDDIRKTWHLLNNLRGANRILGIDNQIKKISESEM
jgi:hypothetical protein